MKKPTNKKDLDLLVNTLNAEAGRFLYSDPHLYKVLIQAQEAILTLSDKTRIFCNDLNRDGMS